MFKYKGTSLGDVFEPHRHSAKISNTKLIEGGVDISQKYQAYNGQSKASKTGYKVNGIDLSDLLAKKGTEVLGNLYKSYTVPGDYTFVPLPGVESYFVVIVGGGGGGGGGGGNNGNDLWSGSGGGGGAAGVITTSFHTLFSPVPLRVGAGGVGGAGGTNYNGSAGGAGEYSGFNFQYASGGGGGGGGKRSAENQTVGVGAYTKISGQRSGDGGKGGIRNITIQENGDSNQSKSQAIITFPENDVVTRNASTKISGGTKGVNFGVASTYSTIWYAGGAGGGAGENGYSRGGAGGDGRHTVARDRSNEGGTVGGAGLTGAGGGGGGAGSGSTKKGNGMKGGNGGNGAIFIYI